MTRTFIPVVSFVSSPNTEKERALYAASSVASGFYPKHGYLVLPQTIPEYKSYCVIIPQEFNIVSQKFWQDGVRGGSLMPKVLSKRMWQETQSVSLDPVDLEIINQFESHWKKIENEVWKEISKLFPLEFRWIGSLEVRITKVGSLSSHYLLEKKKGQHLIINIREDGSHLDIINLLVLALIYPLEKDLGLTFTHRQTIRNFILSRPEFKKIYPGFLPETFDQPKIPVALKRKSEDYIKYLGIPNIIDPIVEINKNIAIFGDKESKLLTELIKRQGEIVTYDDIADLVWGQGKFKSYWAINKLVQRIQRKINDLKINLKIQGIRSRGYKINL